MGPRGANKNYTYKLTRGKELMVLKNFDHVFSSISYIDLHFCLSRFGILCLSYKLFFHFQHCILFLMSYTSQDVFNQELINVHIKLTTIENSRKKMKTNLVMPCHIVIFSYGVETADFGCPV